MKKLILLLLCVPLIGFGQKRTENSSKSKNNLKIQIVSLNKKLDSLRTIYYSVEITFDKRDTPKKLRSKKSLIVEVDRLNLIISNYYKYLKIKEEENLALQIKLKEEKRLELEVAINKLQWELDSLMLLYNFSSHFLKTDLITKKELENKINYIKDSVSNSNKRFDDSIKEIQFKEIILNDLTKKRDYLFDRDRAKKAGMNEEEIHLLAKSKFGNYDKSVTAKVYEVIHNNKYYNGYVVNGLLQGWWKEYYDNGNIHSKTYYLNGIKGSNFRYSDNGKLERIYSSGSRTIGVYKREWNPNGYFIVETIIDSSEDAIFRFYDSDRNFLVEKSERYLREIRETQERKDFRKFTEDLWNK